MRQAYETAFDAEAESDRSAVNHQTRNGLGQSKQNEEPAVALSGDQSLEPLDFRSYSLNVPPASEPDGLAREGNGSLRRLQAIARPTREATLDLGRLDPHLAAFHDTDHQAIAQHNRLAIALISAAAKRPLKRILITSAQHGEGRTNLTLNLAMMLARARQRVLVLDTDLLRPAAHRLLGVDSEVGLGEILARNMPAGAAMVRLLPAGFNVLLTREQIENAAELLASPAFGTLLQKLDPDYDFILFDSAPLLTSADVSLLSLHTQGALLVVRPGVNSTGQMAKAITQLTKESLIGVVLNRTAA